MVWASRQLGGASVGVPVRYFQENSAPHIVLYGARGVICGRILNLRSICLGQCPACYCWKLMLGHTRLHFCSDTTHKGHHLSEGLSVPLKLLFLSNQHLQCMLLLMPQLGNFVQNFAAVSKNSCQIFTAPNFAVPNFARSEFPHPL